MTASPSRRTGHAAAGAARGGVVVVGDALLDTDLSGAASRLCPDAPAPVVDNPSRRSRPGGAGLAAALAAADGRSVTLVTALADDEAGRELADLLRRAGVEVLAAELHGPTPAKVRVRAHGQSLARLDYGCDAPVGALPEAAHAALAGAGVVLVADYGRGLAAHAGVRAALPAASVVWDPHPRGPEPVAGARLVTPNAAEADRVVAPGAGVSALSARVTQAATLAQRWRAAGVAVTLGSEGAVLVAGGAPLTVPAVAASDGADRCGAGDRFAASVAGALADGALASEAVTHGVAAAGAFVAAGGAAALDLDSPAAGRGGTARHAVREPGDGVCGEPAPGRGTDAADRVAATTRSRGGTVVATGGCFDLLHAGHLRMLQSARALGDCLVVYLNSDASVAALKGAGRPLMRAADRAVLLEGLECVDAVVVFDEPTPETALSRLRPDVWVKGGDYDPSQLPEAGLLATWGGQAVVVPYLPGRSTSTLIKEADPA